MIISTRFEHAPYQPHQLVRRDPLAHRSLLAVSPYNSSNVLAGTATGKIYGSTDGGTKWQVYAADLVNVWPLDLDGRAPSVVYAATHGAGSCKSTDGGRTWKRLDAWWRVLAPADSDPGTFFNCGFGGLSISTDGGEKWSAFDSTGLGPFWTYDVVIDPANRNRYFVATDRGVFSYTRKAAGGTRVTIIAPSGTAGTSFNVLFGSALATNIRHTQPDIITCDSPPGTGTVDVKVTTVLTSATVGTFTYQ